MKDTLTLTAIAFIVTGMIRVINQRRLSLAFWVLIAFSFYTIYSIRIYILLCLVPALILWYFLENVSRIRSRLTRLMATPLVITIALISSYFALDQISKEHHRYSLDKLAFTAEKTAKWISYVSTVEQGSGYILGDFDYSVAGMIRKFPLAINVTLFRPYIWEVQNPVMLFAALESIVVLLVTLVVLFKVRLNLVRVIKKNSLVIFLLVFSISFAFAVGFSTYNFGSLVRYKIPLIPLYLSALSIIYYLNKERNFGATASTE